MDASIALLIIAALAFIAEAFSVTVGTLSPKWWAIGVAAYLLSLAV